jgi:hypothetical protein
MYTVGKARYSKGNLIVRPQSDGTGFKSNESKILDTLGFRYTGRENGYVGSPKKVETFEKLVNGGWKGSKFGDSLTSPNGEVFKKKTRGKPKDPWSGR